MDSSREDLRILETLRAMGVKDFRRKKILSAADKYLDPRPVSTMYVRYSGFEVKIDDKSVKANLARMKSRR